MINLLPPKEKEDLLLRQKEKLFLIWEWAFLIFLICLCLLLILIKYQLLTLVDYQKNLFKEAKQKTEIAEFVDLNKTVQKYNEILSQLKLFHKKESRISDVWKIMIDIERIRGLYLNNFLLTKPESGNIQVKISGYTNSRENLLVLKKNMEEKPGIKNLYFPLENWLEPENINFYLTFEVGLETN